MKRNIFVLIAISLLLVLSSCTALPILNSRQTWWYSWILQPACSPPCWENIIPGETTIEEAILVLTQLPNVEITNNDDYGISWAFEDKDTVQVGSGDIQIDQDGVVRFLSLGNAMEQELTLIKVIEKYNEPSFISPYYCREGLCDAIIMYPELGMALRIFTEDIGEESGHSIFIATDTVIKYVVFFSTNSKETNMGGFDDGLFEDFVSWKGFGAYP